MIPKAFIFDLDGVLVDTACCHYQAWKELTAQYGLRFDREMNQLLKGISRQRSLEVILEQNHALDRYSARQKEQMLCTKNDSYVQMVRQLTPKDILPGVECFLQQARQKNIRLAVASASRNAFTVLKRLELLSQFDYVSDASKIQNPKPHPEVFLDCAAALGVEPSACVGFEDAQAGIEAIHAAGMYAVGIGVEGAGQMPDISLSQTKELCSDAFFHRLAELPDPCV